VSVVSAERTKIAGPYVGTLPRAELNSDTELIRKVRYEYSNGWTAHQWEFAQIIDTWKFYFGAIGEQWDDEARRYKTERQMRIAQYNIIRNKVRTFTGMLAADEYDGHYDPLWGGRNSGIEAIEFAYDCDKELMGYDNTYWQLLLDGVIHVGTLELLMSFRKDYRGNLDFIRCLPGRWITDPYWKTNDIYDCMSAWKQGHMTAEDLKRLQDKLPDSDRFERELKKAKKIGMRWSEPRIEEYDEPFPTFQDAWHVIEQHEVHEIRKKRLIARTPDEKWIPFPITEDNETLEKFATDNGITDWQNGAKLVPYYDRVCTLTRICHDLWPNKVLAHGKPEIQVKGLPITQFTCDRDIAGRNMGIVNDLMDPQRDINYAKSKRQELLASAQGGAPLYDKTMMPDEGDQEDFEKNHNDVTRAWGLTGDPRKFMTRMVDKPPAGDLVRESQEPFDIVDRISGVSAAMSSKTQGASEPMGLYEMKLKVNKVGTLPIDKRVRMVRVWMYQSYFFQTQISYAGDEREFTSRDGKKRAKLNERLPNGAIRNKVDEIPLSSVTITESAGNLTRQLRDRAEIASMLEAVPKEYREAIAIMIGEAFKTMNLSEDKKEAIDQAIALEQAKARIASFAEITAALSSKEQAKTAGLQAKIMGMQLEKQLQQILAPSMAPQQQQVPEMITQGPSPVRRAVTPGSPAGLQPAVPPPTQGVFQ
jgi:hypothetical protein